MFKTRQASAFAALGGLIFIAVFNVGTVRKKSDPILKTQTDPIKLKDKLEEVKDGEKGPATPVFGWYGGGNKFMIAPPFDKMKAQELPAEPANKISEVDLTEKKPEELDSKSSDWEEDIEAGKEKEPEFLEPKADKKEESLPSEESPPANQEKQEDSSKSAKDWWDAI